LAPLLTLTLFSVEIGGGEAPTELLTLLLPDSGEKARVGDEERSIRMNIWQAPGSAERVA
jgi:hypothetical protein